MFWYMHLHKSNASFLHIVFSSTRSRKIYFTFFNKHTYFEGGGGGKAFFEGGTDRIDHSQ